MGNYTIFQMFENPRRGKQARNFTRNVPKILDLKSSSEQIFSENCRWVPLKIQKNLWKKLAKSENKQRHPKDNQLLFISISGQYHERPLDPMRRVVWIYKRRNALFTYKTCKEERSENIPDGSVPSSLSFNSLQENK